MGKTKRKPKIVPSEQYSSVGFSFIDRSATSTPSEPSFAHRQRPPSPSLVCPGRTLSASMYPCHSQCCPPPPPYPYPTQASTNTSTSRSSCDSPLTFPPPLPPRGRILIGRHAARFNVKTPPSTSRSGGNNSVWIRKTFINPMVSSRRGCTDVACCFLFIIFTIAWAFVATLGKRLSNCYLPYFLQ
ncbi:hypothetical protein Tcan_05373 [Toxocara canis]|uniref:Uncharacterized protein n=1 Tax=Toxocara canis TaxID=6265 RepID=A0A0B2VZL9_TOXCA|nr:hypothetical protein Tcan_05373 [Toxocara canis]